MTNNNRLCSEDRDRSGTYTANGCVNSRDDVRVPPKPTLCAVAKRLPAAFLRERSQVIEG